MKHYSTPLLCIVLICGMAWSCGQTNDVTPKHGTRLPKNDSASFNRSSGIDKNENATATAIPAIHQITIVAQEPDDAPAVVYLSGNTPQLGPWNPTALKMRGSTTERTAMVLVPKGYPFEYRITAGAWEQEGLGPNKIPMEPFKVIVDEDKTVTTERILL